MSMIADMHYNEVTQDMEILMADGELIKAFFPTKRGKKKVTISDEAKNIIVTMKNKGASYTSITEYLKNRQMVNSAGKPISRYMVVETIKRS